MFNTTVPAGGGQSSERHFSMEMSEAVHDRHGLDCSETALVFVSDEWTQQLNKNVIFPSGHTSRSVLA